VRGNRLQYRGFKFVSMEPKRPGPALVSYAPRPINQIKPIRPSSVRTLCRIPKLVEHCGNFNSQFAHASSSYESTFLFIVRTGEDDLLFYVALHLPDVAGVRLGDVDDQKCDPVSELLVELVEGRNLPPEGRSRVASKHQHHRTILRGEGR